MIKRLPSLLTDHTAETESWGGITRNSQFPTFETKFNDMATDLLFSIEIEKDSPAFCESHFNLDMKFLKCLVDSRLRFLTLEPRRLRIRSNDWAITSPIANSSWVAVPVAVAHLPIWAKKAWVLESFLPVAHHKMLDGLGSDIYEPSKEQDSIPRTLVPDCGTGNARRLYKGEVWRLIQKQVIFGCQPIVPDGKSVILIKKTEGLWSAKLRLNGTLSGTKNTRTLY
jgi:hypothetical protein